MKREKKMLHQSLLKIRTHYIYNILSFNVRKTKMMWCDVLLCCIKYKVVWCETVCIRLLFFGCRSLLNSRYWCQRPTIIHKWLTSHAVNHIGNVKMMALRLFSELLIFSLYFVLVIYILFYKFTKTDRNEIQ